MTDYSEYDSSPDMAVYAIEELQQRIESLERELAEAKEAHKTDLAYVSMSRDEEAQAHIEELDERCNGMTSAIESIHAETGCEREWTNLHDLFVCVHDAVRVLISHLDSSDKSLSRSEARCKRLEGALVEIMAHPTTLGCRSECRASRSMAEMARAALATDEPSPVQRLEAATEAMLDAAHVKLGRDEDE